MDFSCFSDFLWTHLTFFFWLFWLFGCTKQKSKKYFVNFLMPRAVYLQSLQLLELLCAYRKSSVSQKSHVLHISASKLRLLKISANGTDFQCVYFPQWQLIRRRKGTRYTGQRTRKGDVNTPAEPHRLPSKCWEIEPKNKLSKMMVEAGCIIVQSDSICRYHSHRVPFSRDRTMHTGRDWWSLQFGGRKRCWKSKPR